MENYEWECIVALSNIWNVFARFVKRGSKKFTSILIENSVVFALAIYWSTQQRASLALCSGIPIPNSKKIEFQHATRRELCAYIWNRRTNATVIWYLLCFLAFENYWSFSVYTDERWPCKRWHFRNAGQFRIPGPSLLLLQKMQRAIWHRCQFFNCFGIRSLEWGVANYDNLPLISNLWHLTPTNNEMEEIHLNWLFR